MQTLDFFAAGDGLPLRVLRMAPQVDLDLHRHGFAELVVVTGGEGRHRIAGADYPISAGDVFAIPVQMPHGYARCRDLHLTNVVFDADRLGLAAGELRAVPGYLALLEFEPRLRRAQAFAAHLHLGPEALAVVCARLDALAAELSGGGPGRRAAGVSLLTLLLLDVARRYGEQDTPQARALTALSSLLAELVEHPERRWPSAVLARRCGISARTVQRLFRSALGTSPAQHLIALRLERARALLSSDPTLSRAQIAARCGLGSANYLTRLLHRQHKQ